jgi:hypothetical protein
VHAVGIGNQLAATKKCLGCDLKTKGQECDEYVFSRCALKEEGFRV